MKWQTAMEKSSTLDNFGFAEATDQLPEKLDPLN